MGDVHRTIAIICDCDETLAPDTTNFLLEQNGVDIDKFWADIDANFILDGWDPPQAYLSEILNMMKDGRIKQNTIPKMRKLAKKVKPYSGVNTFITELQEWVSDDPVFIRAGINLEGYIISSGIEDLVRGCTFAKQFRDVFAGNYSVDGEGRYSAIKSISTFTEKTKFLYAINKGIEGRNLRKYPYLVNDYVEKHQRRIPFENMLYIGDGPSDIPCFSAVRSNGGHCIGIINKQKPKKAYELASGRRTNYGIYSSDYSRGSDLRLMVETVLAEIRKKISCRSGV